MDLDKRVLQGRTYLDCFETEEARKYIGKECYFTSKPENFENLSKVPHAILYNVDDSSTPFQCYGDDGILCYDRFILPCEWVMEESESKYRPYTRYEFLKKFECGKPITIRYKDDCINIFIETMSSIRIDNFMDDVHVRIFGGVVNLKRLFEEFEWQQSNGSWEPFGVRVEGDE